MLPVLLVVTCAGNGVFRSSGYMSCTDWQPRLRAHRSMGMIALQRTHTPS